MKENRLIAEFMNIEDYQEMGKYVTPNYHNSWDWLMPVVDKIFSLGYDYTIKPLHMIIKERMGEIVSECIGIDQSQEEVIYQAVVEFIKQFNK